MTLAGVDLPSALPRLSAVPSLSTLTSLFDDCLAARDALHDIWLPPAALQSGSTAAPLRKEALESKSQHGTSQVCQGVQAQEVEETRRCIEVHSDHSSEVRNVPLLNSVHRHKGVSNCSTCTNAARPATWAANAQSWSGLKAAQTELCRVDVSSLPHPNKLDNTPCDGSRGEAVRIVRWMVKRVLRAAGELVAHEAGVYSRDLFWCCKLAEASLPGILNRLHTDSCPAMRQHVSCAVNNAILRHPAGYDTARFDSAEKAAQVEADAVPSTYSSKENVTPEQQLCAGLWNLLELYVAAPELEQDALLATGERAVRMAAALDAVSFAYLSATPRHLFCWTGQPAEDSNRKMGVTVLGSIRSHPTRASAMTSSMHAAIASLKGAVQAALWGTIAHQNINFSRQSSTLQPCSRQDAADLRLSVPGRMHALSSLLALQPLQSVLGAVGQPLAETYLNLCHNLDAAAVYTVAVASAMRQRLQVGLVAATPRQHIIPVTGRVTEFNWGNPNERVAVVAHLRTLAASPVAMARAPPIVVRGGAAVWPAVRSWTVDELVLRAGRCMGQVRVAPGPVFPFTQPKYAQAVKALGCAACMPSVLHRVCYCMPGCSASYLKERVFERNDLLGVC
jgi:hypothetical protein